MLKGLVPAADRRTMPGSLVRVRRHALSQGGFTLIELVIAMVLMVVVLTVISTTFVSGSRSESNLANRVQTQSDARQALIDLRNDLHCSYAVQSIAQNPVTASNPSGLGYTLSLTEFFNTCLSTVSNPGAGSKVFLAWCTLPKAGSTTLFEFYRAKSACDSTGRLVASDIVAPQSGWPAPSSIATAADGVSTPTSSAGNIFPTTPVCQLGYLQTLNVDLAVNSDPVKTPNQTYELKDQIALRNSTRCGTGAGGKATIALTVSAVRGALVGSGVTASAAVSGSAAESSPILFYVIGPRATAPTDCVTGATATGSASTSGDNVYASSLSYTPSTPGNYWWYATIAADSNNISMTSTCGPTMPETIVLGSKANPTLTFSSAPTTGTTGTTIANTTLAATLALSSGVVTGTITFKVFGPQATAPTSCGTGGTTIGTALPSGNGAWNPSAGFVPASSGTYWWYASFGGDPLDNSAATKCGTGIGMANTVVSKANPTLSAAGPATAFAGATIAASSITGTLAGSSGAVTGAITFKVFGPQAAAPVSCAGGTTVGTANPTVDGVWSPGAGYAPPSAGTYWWYASFAGDVNDNAVNSTCGAGMSSTVVGKTSPTLTATGPGTGTVGAAITAASIDATLAGSSAGANGIITVKVFGPQASAPVSCAAGTTAGTVTPAGSGTYHPSAGYTPGSAGTYWWYASFAGDANDNAATSTCGGGMSSTVVSLPDTFGLTNPGTQTAGSAFNLTITAKLAAGGTDTGYSGSHVITFTGAPNGPNGAAPVYPATVTFTNGVGVANITLYKAASTTLTATEALITGSTTFTVNPAAKSKLEYVTSAAGASNACPTGTQSGLGNGGSITVFVAIVDAYANLTANGSAAIPIAITRAPTSGGGNAPSPAALTVAANANPAVTSASSLFKLPNGTPAATTYTSTAAGLTSVACVISK